MSAENGLMFMKVDIGNEYLNTETKENIYSRAGPDFEMVNVMANGNC